MGHKFQWDTKRPFQPLQQLMPHQQSNDIHVYHKPISSNHSELYGLILPIAAAGASIIVLIAIILTMCFFKRKKSTVSDIGGPSIVVYPSQQGASPQFLTRDILFSLPVLRQSSSLGDLIDDDSDQDADTLLLAGPPSSATIQQRSHSFSCYGLGVVDPSMYRPTSSDLELDGSDAVRFPDGHIGRVWFSVRHEPATEKLLVSLLKAKNLPSRTVGSLNACDPIVRLALLPDERRCQQSKLKKKTCNPFFDETFVFQAPSKDLLDHTLKFTLIDAGSTKRRGRGIIGHVTLPLAEFASDPEQKLFKLDLEREIQQVLSDLGQLLISLTYNDKVARLSVAVIEARRLKFKDEKQDSYVKITLNQNYRPVKVKRTATIRGTDNPNFSECFNFKLAPEMSDVSNLTFQIYQHAVGYTRDKLIGKFVLGSNMFVRGKANEHWTEMFAKPKETIQQWHSLTG